MTTRIWYTMFVGPCLNGRFGKRDRETVYRNCQALCTMGRKTWRHGVPHEQNCAVCGDNLAKINIIYHFYAPGQLEYSSIDKMAKYDWSTFRNYVAFLAGELAPGTRHPHHDSESSSCYHDAFLPWGHYHNNIVLFYHDSPITRSHFMDPTDRAIKGFYCINLPVSQRIWSCVEKRPPPLCNRNRWFWGQITQPFGERENNCI